jgi:hypothetical protein
MDFIIEAEKTNVRSHRFVARLIIDTNKKKILFVPSDINHPEFLANHLELTVEVLKRIPSKVSPFIGGVVGIVDGKAALIFIGLTGLETVFSKYLRPLHQRKNVDSARDLVLATLQAGELLAPRFKLKTVYK